MYDSFVSASYIRRFVYVDVDCKVFSE